MTWYGGFPLPSATPSYPLTPKITKQTIHKLPTGPYMVNFKLHLYFPWWGWVGVVIIKLKANLNSTGTGLNWNWAWQKNYSCMALFGVVELIDLFIHLNQLYFGSYKWLTSFCLIWYLIELIGIINPINLFKIILPIK